LIVFAFAGDSTTSTFIAVSEGRYVDTAVGWGAAAGWPEPPRAGLSG
jgi:hypothetical protein